jgi:hypothetical protein
VIRKIPPGNDLIIEFSQLAVSLFVVPVLVPVFIRDAPDIVFAGYPAARYPANPKAGYLS